MSGTADEGAGARGAGSPLDHVSGHRMHDALDGLLESAETERIEKHLRACPPCREEYARLSETVRGLRSLPKGAEPPEALWMGIARRIAGARERTGGSEGDRAVGTGKPEAADVVPLPTRVRASRRFELSGLQLVAAALVVSLLSAGSVWMAMRGALPVTRGQESGPALTRAPSGQGAERFAGTGTDAGPAARAVSSDAERYAETVRRLERILASGRSVLAPETLASIEQSLSTIDAAIGEIEQALAVDPGSDMLRRMLTAHRGTRLGVLQRAAAAVQARI